MTWTEFFHWFVFGIGSGVGFAIVVALTGRLR